MTASQTRARLLVVDDEHNLMLALVAGLERHGFDVTGFDSSSAALEALRAGSFDLLLTDLMMPGLDGLALLRASLEIDPNLVALIMTGQGTVSTAVEALKLGAFDYLLKPFHLPDVLPALERALELRRVRLENVQLRESVALYDLSQAVSATLDPAKVAQLTAAAARQQMGADEAAVLCLAEGDDALLIAALDMASPDGRAGAPSRLGQRVPLSGSIAGWVAGQREPLVLNGPVADARFTARYPRPEIVTAAAIPMIAAGRVTGVLTVNGLGPRRPFTPGQVKALRILANAGAAALENAALVGRVRASEQRYRELIEHASDGIVTITGDGRYLEVNATLLSWLGYTRDELLALNAREVVAAEHLPGMLEHVDQMRLGQSVMAERLMLRKDGTWLQVELSGRQLPDGNFQAILRNITERKQAERALRESEARLTALFQASPAGISITTLAEGRFVDVNTEFERLMGYGRAEVIGRTADELGTWADPGGRQWLVGQLTQHGVVHNAEQRFRRKTGEVIEVLLSLERIELDGQPYVVGLVLDITERKRAEHALRDSETRFAALFQASPAAITLSSLDGRIVDVNQEFERSMGYTRAEVVGQFARDLGTWAAPEERSHVMGRLAQRGALAGQEVHYRRKSGEVMLALSSFETVELAGQRYILTLALDITDRKQAEEQMRFQAGLLAAVGQAVIASDTEGRILYWNRMAEELYGWTAEEALGLNTRMLTPANEERLLAESIWKQVRAGATWSGEYLVCRRDGSLMPAQVTNTPFYDSAGHLAGVIGMSTDISERKQRERELETLGQISTALRGALAADQVPVVILDQLTALFDTRAASLLLIDEARGDTVVAHATGRWARYIGQRDTLDKGMFGQVLRTGLPYATRNAATDPLIFPSEAAEGVGAVAVLPLIAHGQMIGGLEIARSEAFGEGDMRLLHALADILANALQRATLHEQTRLRAEQLAGLNALARALAETLQLEQIYQRLEAATHQLLPDVARVVVSLYDRRLQTLSAVYDDQVRLAGQPDLALAGAAAEVVQARQMVITNRPGEPARALAPLLAKGEVIGVLQAERPAARGFAPDEAALLATVANTAAVAIENARLFAETQRRLLRLQALRTIDLAITSSMDRRTSMRVLVDQAVTQLGVDAVDVLLLEDQSQRLELAAGHGFKTQPPRLGPRLDQGLAGQAFMERRLLRAHLPGDPRTPNTRDAWFAAEGFVAYFGMPVVAKGHVRGVLEVFHRAPLSPDNEWIDFLETLAEQAAIAVDNSLLFADLQRSNTNLELAYDTTLEGWSRALDLRDKETEGHTQRVTDMSERLAHALGLSEAELLQIRRGALLHDIGKMGIPDAILLKPGALTDDEWVIMRRHPQYAFELLAPIAYLQPALDIPYCHHEKWDGTGYPRGLAGERIPLAARMFAVVDVWDALRSDRPYRPAWPEARVREHIRALSGTHFDPAVVQAFMTLILTS